MTIAAIDVGAMSLPETDGRILNRSIGIAASGAVKIKKFRDADRDITIVLEKKSDTIRTNLYNALAAAQTTYVAIAPDAHVDLGGGAGVSVNGYWIDEQFNAVKNGKDAWDITLKFRKA